MRNNIYDVLIIIYLFLLVFGEIGGGFQPVRMFICAMFPFALYYFLTHISIFRKYKNLAVFMVIWLILAFFPLLNSHDFRFSVLRYCYMLCHFCGVFILLYLYERANKPFASICKGWIIMFLFTVPIAITELNLGVHLPNTYHDHGVEIEDLYGDHVERQFASVTFGNLNTYNMLLCYILPFLIASLLENKSRKSWLFYFACFLVFAYIIVYNASRTAFILLVLSLLYYIMKASKRNLAYALGYSILFLGVLVILYIGGFLDVILTRLMEQGVSDSGRMSMILCGLDALASSYFMGIGVGNFGYVMQFVYKQHLWSPHNLFLEILVEFGVFVFVCFCVFLYRIYKRGRRCSVDSMHTVVVLGVLLLPIIGIINSNSLSYASLWLYVGSIYAISKNTKNNIAVV